MPPHTSPATLQPVVPGAEGCVQVPRVAPLLFVQMPAQQSVSLAQASSVCVQKETLPLHVPLLQIPEQQSPLPPQELPAVLQLVLSGTQAEFVHLPLQH